MTKTTTAKTPKIENLDVKEALLAERYPERAIVVGSLLPADFEGNPFPGKQTLEITCCEPGCGETRRIATQDLFQVSRCEACTKAAKRAKKNAGKAPRKAAIGKLTEEERDAIRKLREEIGILKGGRLIAEKAAHREGEMAEASFEFELKSEEARIEREAREDELAGV